MADPVDVQLILDFATGLEELSKCECDVTGFCSNRALDLDRERFRYILSGIYSAPVSTPLMLEIMFTEVLQQ